MPRKGETFEMDHLRFEVLRADARQVHVLLVEKCADWQPQADN
jgi:magnesium and cobalt transporter